MEKKPKFLKSLLTTVSAVAVVASAGNAFAEGRHVLLGAAVLNTGKGLDRTVVPADIAFVANSSLKLTIAGTITNGTVGGGDALAIAAVNTNGFNSTLNANAGAANDFTLGPVIGGGNLDIILDGASTITLTGAAIAALPNNAGSTLAVGAGGFIAAANDYTALRNVTFTNAADSIVIDSSTSLKGTFNATAAGNGNLVVNAAKTVTFDGLIGNLFAIKNLAVGANSTVNLNKTAKFSDVGAEVIKVGNGTTINVANGADLVGVNGDEIINAANANNGTLAFAGASKVTMEVGSGAALNKITIGAGPVEFNGIELKATTTELNNAAAIVKLSGNAAPYTVVSNFTTAENETGEIEVNGQNVNLTGSIGATDKRLSAVKLLTNHALKFTGADDLSLHSKNVTTAITNNGSITVKSNNFVVNATIGATDKLLAAFNIESDKAGAALATVKLAENAIINATTVDLATAAFDNVLELGKGTLINADVENTKANRGTLTIKGNSEITGKIGNVANIKGIIFDTADVSLAVKGTVIKTNAGVDFKTNAKLILTQDAADVTITGATLVPVLVGGTGTITANNLIATKTLTFASAIGDSAVADTNLKLLEVKGGANVKFTGAAAIENIDIGSSDGTIEFNNAGTFLIKKITNENNKGNILLSQDLTFKAGSLLGSSDKKLKDITFNGDKTVTLQDGVNIFAEGGVKVVAVRNTGTLTIQGDSIIDTTIGAKLLEIKAINVTGATAVATSKKTADFLKDVNVVGDITISDGATAILRGDVTAADIKGFGAGVGTVKFANAKTANVTTTIGAGNALKVVEIAGADLTFKAAVTATELTFTSANTTTATFEAAGALAATNFTTTSTKANHNVVLSKFDLVMAGTVGTAANPFGLVTIVGTDAAEQTLTVGNKAFFAGIRTNLNEKNSAVFNAVNGVVSSIGASGAAFKSTTFNENLKVAGDVFSKDITVVAAKEVTFGGNVTGTGTLTLGAGSTALVNGTAGADFAVKVEGAAPANGSLTFARAGTVSETIGATTSLLNVAFNADTNLAKSINATNINVGKNVLRPTADLVLVGKTTFANSTIDLNTKTLTLNGIGSSVTGDASINVEVAADGDVGQMIVSGAGSTLNLNAANTLGINVTDNSLLPDSKGRKFVLIEEDTGGKVTNLAAAKAVTISDNRNGFVTWTFDRTTNELAQKNNAVEKLQAVIKGRNNAGLTADAAILGNPNNTGSASKVVEDLANIKDDKVIAEAVERLTNPVVSSVNTVQAITNSVNANQIGNRVAAISLPSVQTADAGQTGMSAGDSSMYGAWLMPFFNSAEKSNKGTTPGFGIKSVGATIGADLMVNADLTLGAALSYIKTDVKHKGIKFGDKTKADTFMFSVYGLQQLTNEWFVQGSVSFGSTALKNKEKRITSKGNQTANGKFDSTSFGGEALFGYNLNMSGVNLTPMAGIGYTRFNDGGYTETGTTAQNLTINKKATDKVDAIAGAKLNLSSYAVDTMEVTPEVHAFVRHDLIGKAAKVDVKLDGLVTPFTSKKAKIERTTYNLGLGLTAKTGAYDYGIGYDATLAPKYVGHQGSLKVRVNF